MEYMAGTSWGQGQEREEVERDPVRVRLLAAMSQKRKADGSASVPNPSEAMLARLWYEADHLMDGYRFGSAELADLNAGRALTRRIEAIAPHIRSHESARDLMYTDQLPDPGEFNDCWGDPSHQWHSHD
jgi:hypothetical protein